MAFATLLGGVPGPEDEGGDFFASELDALPPLPTSKVLLAELARGCRPRIGRSRPPLERFVSPPLTFGAQWRKAATGDASLHADCLLLACPDEVLTRVLGFIADVPRIGALAAVCPRLGAALRSPEVWQGSEVRLPNALTALAPQLHRWLPAWRSCERLLVPKSAQLLRELETQAPEIPVEVLWRFSSAVKGEGVEVRNSGRSVRRCAGDDLVVIGDAPLIRAPNKPLYLEVSLDDRGEEAGDGVNDFGMGVTPSPPEELEDLGDVADEVPDAWVVNFTASSIVVVADNQEVVRGSELCSQDLSEGDVVGVAFLEGAIQVYLNGQRRANLELPKNARVPVEKELFPVFDLCGRAAQLSRTY